VEMGIFFVKMGKIKCADGKCGNKKVEMKRYHIELQKFIINYKNYI
jgi:hypothetical protein